MRVGFHIQFCQRGRKLWYKLWTHFSAKEHFHGFTFTSLLKWNEDEIFLGWSCTRPCYSPGLNWIKMRIRGNQEAIPMWSLLDFGIFKGHLLPANPLFNYACFWRPYSMQTSYLRIPLMRLIQTKSPCWEQGVKKLGTPHLSNFSLHTCLPDRWDGRNLILSSLPIQTSRVD